MAITAMPKGWVLDEGTLAVDVDEDRTNYNTGGRSIVMQATGKLTRILSEPIPIGVDSSAQDTVRRKLGLTINFAYTHPSATSPGASTQFGFNFYDASGVFIVAAQQGFVVKAAGTVFETEGMVADIPTGAQFCRVFVGHLDASYDLIIDNVIPYAMPPWGLAVTSGSTALVVGSSVNVQLASIPLGLGVFGSHAVALDPVTTGAVVVRECGVYNIDMQIQVDAYTAADDAFVARIVASSISSDGQVFSPAVSKSAMTFPAGTTWYDFKATASIPMRSNDVVQMYVAQLAGTARNVTNGILTLSKET